MTIGALNISGLGLNNGSAYSNAETTSWLDRVATASGAVSGTTAAAVDAFITACKSAGVWSLFRRLNLCCGDFNASFVPLVNTSGGTTDTNVNLVSGDYSESLGWRSDGSTKYINTGYTPSEATGGLSAYIRGGTFGASSVPIGCRNAGTQQYRIVVYVPTSADFSTSWGQTTAATGLAQTPFTGLLQIARTSSTSLSAYRNGGLLSNTATATTPASPSQPMYVLANNGDGVLGAVLPADARLSGYAIDTGMSDAQAAAYYTAMQAFQTALSRNV